jgi:antirestriction protein ArdC
MTSAAMPPSAIKVCLSHRIEGQSHAEALIRATGADLRIGGNRAFYVPSADYIQVPPPSTYFEPINFVAKGSTRRASQLFLLSPAPAI